MPKPRSLPTPYFAWVLDDARRPRPQILYDYLDQHTAQRVVRMGPVPPGLLHIDLSTLARLYGLYETWPRLPAQPQEEGDQLHG